MGKKAKIGKQRKDKFYQLAKETGYRSRAAFKLIQLNRKFEFLQKSRVCLDLCAAPGGWMQVARQNMPVSSIVVGVDLYPIKPITGCISLIGDIFTDKCRQSISKELKTWKADIVLNDGAPNLGINWIHDAYQQAVLTLAAIKLASQFLKRGGWFVTKIFRSKDYHSILWVLEQLFKKVHATKPQASRNESAELFIVCQYYTAPDKVDPKFFDAKYVFSELELTSSKKLNIFHPEKISKSAEGYPENDYTLHYTLSAEKFIAHPTGIELLQEASEIIIDSPRIAEHPKTTIEMKECFKDIKVLNRKDIKKVLSWWKELHNEFHVKPAEEETNKQAKLLAAEVEDKDPEEKEEEEIDQAIAELKEEQRKEIKKKKRKAQKERLKLTEKLNLKMVHKGDEGPRLEGDEMFSLKDIKTMEILENITDQNPDLLAQSESDDDDDDEDNGQKKVRALKKVSYEKDKGRLDAIGLFYKDEESEAESNDSNRKESENEGSDLSLSDVEEDTTTDPAVNGHKDKEEDQFDIDDLENPLVTDLDNDDKKSKKIKKASLWFEKEAFKDLEKESDEEYELEKMVEVFKKKGKKILGEKDAKSQEGVKEKKAAKGKENKKIKDNDSEDSDYNVEDEFYAEQKSKKNMKNKEKNKNQSDVENDKWNEKPAKPKFKRKLNVEDLALGTMLVKSKKSRRDIIDAGWSRFAFNDEHLPDWFAQDEQKHMKREAPVEKSLVEEYKKNLIDINARPIKKVLEAKARKKKRALRKLEKAKKKIENVVDSELTDREKADQIRRLYKQAKRQPKKELTYVVSKKHLAQKKTSRPAGVKGRYKVVDPRMKKDMRAAKAKEKTKGRSKKGGGIRSRGRPKPKSNRGRK